jgi:hypothetical protein
MTRVWDLPLMVGEVQSSWWWTSEAMLLGGVYVPVIEPSTEKVKLAWEVIFETEPYTVTEVPGPGINSSNRIGWIRLTREGQRCGRAFDR